jgi:magnesium chelatase accessory protein
VSRGSAWEREKSTWPHHEWSRFVEAGGVRWHVQQSGMGPTMLLVHGTGASTHSWRKVMPALAQHFNVLAVDLPGHGFTETVPGSRGPAPAAGSGGLAPAAGSGGPAPASISGMSLGLTALLRELGIDVDFCVGHSAGAVVLCRMALDRHIRPQVIIGINGAFVPLAGAAGTLFSPIARLMASGSLLPRLLAWSAGNPASLRRMIEGTGSRLDTEGLDLYARLVRDPRHVAGALDMMGNWDLYGFERDLSRLRTRLALIVASNDRTVPPRQAEWVRQRVSTAEIHLLPGLGHLAHEEDPDRVTREILDICRVYRVNAPGAASANRSGPPSAR